MITAGFSGSFLLVTTALLKQTNNLEKQNRNSARGGHGKNLETRDIASSSCQDFRCKAEDLLLILRDSTTHDGAENEEKIPVEFKGGEQVDSK